MHQRDWVQLIDDGEAGEAAAEAAAEAADAARKPPLLQHLRTALRGILDDAIQALARAIEGSPQR